MKKLIEKRETIFTILSYVLAIAAMAIVCSLLGKMVSGDLTSSSIFLGIAFLCEAGYNGILFFKYNKKRDMIRISIVAILFIITAVLAFISNTGNYLFFIIASFVFLITLSLNRFLMITKSKDAKWNITNGLLSLLFLAMAIICITDLSNVYVSATIIVLVDSIMMLFMSFEKVILPTLRFEKIKVLFNILNVTHTLDVLICLLGLMIAFSFVFPMTEEGIPTFWDGLWYSFAVITTIGFGDYAATSALGRVLTVILGLYGIVIVAIITSVIVNFYNSVSDKKTEKKVDEIVQSVREAKEQEEEIKEASKRKQAPRTRKKKTEEK